MTDRTPIEWADVTWNPIGGCTRVSEGCKNCYAEIMAARFSGPGQWGEGLARIVRDATGKIIDHRWTGQMRFNQQALDRPLRWRKPRRIFVNSTSDLFHEAVPDEWIDRVFAVMALCPQHTFMVLTKRPQRMYGYFTKIYGCLRHNAHCYDVTDRVASEAAWMARAPVGVLSDVAWPLPNVWLGTSIEDQATAEARIPHLLATPAAVRFVSAEPLLGPVFLDDMCDGFKFLDALRDNWWHDSDPPHIERGKPRLDWVIVGGESGPGARPMHPNWARALRDQCQAAGVAFFFKQWGEWFPGEIDNASDGRGWVACPDADHDPGADDWEGRWKYRRLDDQGFLRVGKARAGRLLDGREWHQFPGGANAQQ